jgi:hypothetical protein
MEHEALLEMVNVKGQTMSEFVRECIMVSLCGSWESFSSDEEFEKIDSLIMKNSKRFRQ